MSDLHLVRISAKQAGPKRNSPSYKREWYLRNRSRILAKRTVNYQANREEQLSQMKARSARPEVRDRRRETWKVWYEAKRAERIAYSREWRKRNPEKTKAICAIQRMVRRGRERKAAGAFSYTEWLAKVEFHGWRCIYCKQTLCHSTLTMEHRKPLSRGGSNWLSNLAPACRTCNVRKNAKTSDHPAGVVA